ncbi:MAG: MBOAT family O-acyltransferase [Thermoplasmatota archaeon]
MTCDALFNTRCFVLGFLPIVLLGYWLIPGRRWKQAWLMVAGFVFYSFWDVRFTALLIAAAIVDYFVARKLEDSAGATHRKRWLVVSIVFNLGVLAFFKYFVFAVENARTLMDLAGLSGEALPYYNIVLPVGISFFTFKTMSYTIDVYRGEVKATRDFIKYLCFISMFPELVAGPIIRYRDMDQQLDAIPRWPRARFFGVGITLFAIGLAKKVLVADTIAAEVDPLWTDTAALNFALAWEAALGYTLQLYFDFSGYSDMALGLAAMLSFRFPINFRAPYQALNPSDFWRRWHISLSSWLRDYLYIPLGGNRKGPSRTMVNLFIVMLLGGLWHGANWTFVIWGAYHGLLLAIYQKTGSAWDAMPKAIQRLLMVFLAVVGWVIFRAPDLTSAGNVYAAMFGFEGIHIAGMAVPLVLGLLAALAFTMLVRPSVDQPLRPTWPRALACSILLALSIVWMSRESPFLYYQF